MPIYLLQTVHLPCISQGAALLRNRDRLPTHRIIMQSVYYAIETAGMINVNNVGVALPSLRAQLKSLLTVFPRQ